MTGSIYCTSCGTPNEHGAEYCSKCGSQLGLNEGTVRAARTPRAAAPQRSPVPAWPEARAGGSRARLDYVHVAAGVLMGIGFVAGLVGLLFQGIGNALQGLGAESLESAMGFAGAAAIGGVLLALAIVYLALGIGLASRRYAWIQIAAIAVSAVSAFLAIILLVTVLFQSLEVWQVLVMVLLLLALLSSFSFVMFVVAGDFGRNDSAGRRR